LKFLRSPQIQVLLLFGSSLGIIKGIIGNNMKLENVFFKNKTVDNSKLDEALSNVDRSHFRVDFLTDKEKKMINKFVDSGKEVNLDVIRNIIGRDRAREIHWDSIALKLNERDNIRERRRAELLNLGKDKEPFILGDGQINIIDIHGINPGDNQKEIIHGLPEELDKNIIQVEYSEKSSSNTEDIISDELGVMKMVDSSGKINSNYLSENFKLNDKSSFIMTGGNLRGCFLEALNGIVREASKVETSKVDFHIPLDKCYDDSVFDKITSYKDLSDAILKIISKPSEVYVDGELEATTGTEKDLDSKFRFYIWEKASLLINKIATQFRNKENDSEIENMIQKQKIKDDEELSKIRDSLKF